MQLSVVFFSLFAVVAMAELRKWNDFPVNMAYYQTLPGSKRLTTLLVTEKVPRSAKQLGRRQAAVDVQTPAMTDANGNVIAFDAAQVYKFASEQGI
jgi:hypothetical protein